MRRELAANQNTGVIDLNPKALRTQLRGLLGDWNQLLTDDVAKARPLLSLVLADKIVFEPVKDGYELTVPVALDRVLTTLIPTSRNLSDIVASPTGNTHFFLKELRRSLRKAA